MMHHSGDIRNPNFGFRLVAAVLGCVLAVLALALLPLPAVGQGEVQGKRQAKPQADPLPPQEGDHQDLIYLGESAPVLLRFRVEIDGKSVREAWSDYARRWFAYLDRDGDGMLDKNEAKYAPRAQTIEQLRRVGFASANVRPSNSLAEFDTNKDGKVSQEEMVAYFNRSPVVPLQTAPQAAPNQQPQQLFGLASDALFKYLDPEKTGKLTKETVQKAAANLLRQLDTDDDELLSPSELLPGVVNPLGRQQQPVAGAGGQGGRNALYLVPPSAQRQQLATTLINSYGKNKKKGLSQKESGLDEDTFARLDTNKDGPIPNELKKWTERPADIDVIIRFSLLGPKEMSVEVRMPATRQGKDGQTAKQGGNANAVVSVGDAQLNIQCVEPVVPNRPGQQRQSQLAMQLFQKADAKQKGYLEMKDVGGGQYQILSQVFAAADRDGDGKLTRKELQEYLDLNDDAMRLSASMVTREEGRSLFQLLDTNRDGRLSLRELRSAWDRLASMDRNGDGVITPDEISRQFHLVVNQGQAINPQGQPNPGARGQAAAPPSPKRGPLWFQRMDVNGDGDVSPREFLGSMEDFRRIDTNGDGLIDADEAERAMKMPWPMK